MCVAGLAFAQEGRTVPPNLDPAFWGRAQRPYVATVVTTSAQTGADGAKAERTTEGRRYRDDAGRERSEGFYDSGQPADVMLRDPRQTRVVMLTVVGKTADVLFVPRPDAGARDGVWTTEALPARTFLGVRATGERFRRVVPADANGSGRPITVLEDAWFSEDLGIVLLQMYQDPRTGTFTRTVTQLQQMKPDPALFEIPKDYTVHQSEAGKQ